MKNKLLDLIDFGYSQAMSCIFPVVIFAALAITKWLPVPGMARYDVILIICLLTQILMVVFRLETIDELKVICVFHIIGLCLELYKVHMGSWSYPEAAWSKIGGVPLYSGFMYASVASFMCQSWRRLQLRITNWPKSYWALGISLAIYLNFFTHHYIWDMRWLLTGALVIIFWRSKVWYSVRDHTYKMPLVLSFLLIGFFIWIAENISTLFGAWTYPNQQQAWQMVHIGKISSWFLLVVISLIIVAQLKRLKSGAAEKGISA